MSASVLIRSCLLQCTSLITVTLAANTGTYTAPQPHQWGFGLYDPASDVCEGAPAAGQEFRAISGSKVEATAELGCFQIPSEERVAIKDMATLGLAETPKGKLVDNFNAVLSAGMSNMMYGRLMQCTANSGGIDDAQIKFYKNRDDCLADTGVIETVTQTSRQTSCPTFSLADANIPTTDQYANDPKPEISAGFSWDNIARIGIVCATETSASGAVRSTLGAVGLISTVAVLMGFWMTLREPFFSATGSSSS